MKIVRPICCGMDVHKNSIVATIASTDSNGVTTYKQREFSTFNYDLFKLRDWLINNQCLDVCMESTGKYWIPIFNILEEKLNVYLTHPKYVKAIKGKKTDKKDSKWIADVFKHDLLKFSFIPPKIIRELREISRYRIKLVGMASIEHSCIESDQRFKMDVAAQHLDSLSEYIQLCEIEMVKRCISFFPLVGHISSLPGISTISAMIILSEIGIDMNQWSTEKELVSWAGLSPGNNESANKKKSVRITKAGQYLKPILVQCALAAIKSKKEPYFRTKYHTIKKRRGHKKAIIAIARKLLISIYHMVLTGEVFNPVDYDTYQKPVQAPKITTNQALEHLKSLGVDISKIKIPE